MAEISFHNIAAERASERFYVWPVYNAGRVRQIGSVERRDQPDGVYIKPTPEERDNIIGRAKSASDYEYLPNGKIGRASSLIRPGSLFEAIA